MRPWHHSPVKLRGSKPKCKSMYFLSIVQEKRKKFWAIFQRFFCPCSLSASYENCLNKLNKLNNDFWEKGTDYILFIILIVLCNWWYIIYKKRHLSRFCLLRLLRLLRLPVDAILSANPLYCSRWQHLWVALNTKTGKPATVFTEPSLKCAVTYTSRICEFIFVCAFHGLLICLQRYEKSERNANKNAFIFTSERNSSSTKSRYDFFSTIPRKITSKTQIIYSYLVKSGQRCSTLFPSVVPL